MQMPFSRIVIKCKCFGYAIVNAFERISYFFYIKFVNVDFLTINKNRQLCIVNNVGFIEEYNKTKSGAESNNNN